MLLALTYTTDEEFEDDYVAALVEEANELAAEHTWWNQPFALAADSRNPALLTGTTQLLHRYLTDPDGSTRKIDYRDDVIMSTVDTLALFEMLSILSKEHEFTWSIGIPARPRPKHAGKIVNGEIEPKLFELIMPEVEANEITEAELEDQSLHQQIRQKYFK